MFWKGKIKYLVILIVCVVLDLAILIFSFKLSDVFGLDSSKNTTEYQAAVAGDLSEREEYYVLPLNNARLSDAKKQKPGVACTLLFEKDDVVSEEILSELSADREILFLLKDHEKELTEGEEVLCVAMRVKSENGSDEDIHIATLDLHNAAKLKKIKYVKIASLLTVIALLFVAGFSLCKICGVFREKPRW